MERFAGKVALVSGGAGGIGRAVAARLAEEGATVVALDVTTGADVVTGDVTSPDDCARAVATVVDRHRRLDVLVNAAGIGGFWPVADFPPAEFARIVAVNLTGAFLLSQAALAPLLEVGGNIVNLASTAGLRATAYNAAYCASKGGLIMLTRSMAVELAAAGVRVNAVCPSAVDTPLLRGMNLPDLPAGADRLFARNAPPMGRVLDVDEVATAVAYLASGDAKSVTGSTFVIDGGATA